MTGLLTVFDVLIAGLSLILVVATVIMAIIGLADGYQKCSIIAFIVLIFDLVTMLLTHNIVLAILQSIMLVVYIVLAKILQKNS